MRTRLICNVASHLIVASALVAVPPNLSAQTQSPSERRITLNFGVDTTAAITDSWGDYSWHGPVPEIIRNWIMYLRADSAGRAVLWSPSERKRWPLYDIAGIMSDPGFAAPATIAMVQPSIPGASDSYIIKTLYATADSSKAVRPLFSERVYAVREGGRWVFADSLADAYGIPRLPDFTYYVTNSEDDMFRAAGVEPMFGADGRAGRSLASDRIIMSGSPEQGEGYVHEVVHTVFGPLTPLRGSSFFTSEVVASWLGGSLGADFPTLMHNYAAYLRAHPTVTLDSVFTENYGDRGQRPAAAMLFEMAHAHGDVPAVKILYAAPTRSLADIRTAVTTVLGIPWSAVQQQWRDNIYRY